MWLIKKYYDEKNYDEIHAEDMKQFMIDNASEFKKGYRFYNHTVSKTNDITECAESIIKSKEIIMMRPAFGAFAVGNAAVNFIVDLFSPDIPTPEVPNRQQSSSTNALGNRLNESALGARRDDIRGRVNGHCPRLIQVPHTRFTDNEEEEHFAVHISHGKVSVENPVDGRTKFTAIPGARLNVWWPEGNPNHPTNTTPDIQFGGLINRPLSNISEARELQATELIPPNEAEVANINWLITTTDNGNGTYDVSIFGSNIIELGLDLTDYVETGDNFNLDDFFISKDAGPQTLYDAAGAPETFAEVDIFDVSGQYSANNVTSDTVIFTTSNADFAGLSSSQAVYNSYFTENGYLPSDPNYLSFNTLQSKITTEPWYSDSSVGVDDRMTYLSMNNSPSVGSIVSNVEGNIRIPDGTDSLWLNLVSSNGFYKLVENNDTRINAQVDVIFSARDESDQKIGTDTVITVNYSTNQDSITKQAALTADFTRDQWEVTNGASYYTLSARRATNRDKSENVSNVDKIIWRDCFFSENIGDQDYGNVTMGQVVIPSSPTARATKERRLKVDCVDWIEPYQSGGTFGELQPVETWAEVLISLALDDLNGRLSIEEIDAELLLEVQQQLIDYYGTSDFVKVGYNLDKNDLRFQDIYRMFCKAVDVSPYAIGAQYKAYPNIKREESSKQFTHRNKISGKDSRERIYNKLRDNDGIELKYRSNKTGNFETIILHANGTNSNNRLNIELSAATQECTATIRAYRELNILKHQAYNISFEADGIATRTTVGERVDNVDSTRIVKRDNNDNVYQIYDGQVQAQNGLEVELSNPVFFTDGELHTIRFTDKDGNLSESIECTKGATDYHVVLAEAPSVVIYTGYNRDKTTYTFCADNLRHSMAMIVRSSKANESKGLKTRKMSGINDDDRYYTNDKDFAV